MQQQQITMQSKNSIRLDYEDAIQFLRQIHLANNCESIELFRTQIVMNDQNVKGNKYILFHIKQSENYLNTRKEFELLKQKQTTILQSLRQSSQRNNSNIPQQKDKAYGDKQQLETQVSPKKTNQNRIQYFNETQNEAGLSLKKLPTNTMKNILIPFKTFALSYLSVQNYQSIINKQTPTLVDLSKSIKRYKQPHCKQFKTFIEDIKKYFPSSGTYNNLKFKQLCMNKNIKSVFEYWLVNLADYWLYKYSRESIQNIIGYRKSIPHLIISVKNNSYSKITISQLESVQIQPNPKKPQCLLETKQCKLVKRRDKVDKIKLNTNNTPKIKIQEGTQLYDKLLNKDESISNFGQLTIQEEDSYQYMEGESEQLFDYGE